MRSPIDETLAKAVDAARVAGARLLVDAEGHVTVSDLDSIPDAARQPLQSNLGRLRTLLELELLQASRLRWTQRTNAWTAPDGVGGVFHAHPQSGPWALTWKACPDCELLTIIGHGTLAYVVRAAERQASELANGQEIA